MKNSYQTRRLLALRDIRHDGQTVSSGGEIFATEIDARYLIRCGDARDHSAALPPVAAAPTAAAAPPRRGPGRTPKTEPAARAPAASVLTTSDADALSGAGPGTNSGDNEPNPDAGPGPGDADGAGQSGDQTAG